ncbi:MAG: hypothetical protein HYW07_09610, partial [Candidatus Latescibacteria bacterium]|nr:hypothetical protein [Candidatus Latescibacterota bacterium]
MNQKVSYLIIGLLSGLLLREWAVRPADSQTTIVRAQQFNLVDADGNVTASLYNTGLGPALYMGRADEPYVFITASAEGAELSVSHSSGVDPYVLIRSGEGRADIHVASTASGAPRLLLSNSATAAGMSVSGGGGTALVTVNGGGNNKTVIGANASGSSIT